MNQYSGCWTLLDEIRAMDSMCADTLVGYAEGIKNRVNWGTLDQERIKEELKKRLKVLKRKKVTA